MKHSALYVILLVLMTVGCKPKVPSELVQPDDLEDILYEYHLAQSMARNEHTLDASYNQTKYFLAVLEKHHVSEAVFDSSLVYYYTHAERLKDIYANVYERLANDAKKLGASVGDINRYSQYSETGDTANIWRDETAMLLIPHPTKNRFDFVIKADSTFKVGDSFTFQFMAEHIWQSGVKDAVVCIRTTYEGDSILQTVNHLSASGTFQLYIPANRTQNIKEMRGFIYLPNSEESADVRQLMFISQIQLIRFHNKEIESTNENESETVEADSMQRVDNIRRSAPDTPMPDNREGLRSKNAPFRKGGSSDGVDARADKAN